MRADFGNVVVFTGRLASMKHEEAFALVRERGGTPRRGVTKKTSVLVVGEFGWPLLPDGRPANSLKLAKDYGVRIESERRFLEWAGKLEPDDQPKTYTPAQLARLSGLPLRAIEELTTFGLLDARDGHYGFRDLPAARQLAELIGSGVALSTITKSLHEIRKWLPDAALSNLRLSPATRDAILVEQMKGRTDKTGQFVLPVDLVAEDDPDDLFEQAQAAEETGDPADCGAALSPGPAARPARPGRAVQPRKPAAPAGQACRGRGGLSGRHQGRPGLRGRPGTISPACARSRATPRRRWRTSSARSTSIRTMRMRMFNLGMLYLNADHVLEAAICWRRYLALDQSSDVGGARPPGAEILRDADRAIVVGQPWRHRAKARQARRRRQRSARAVRRRSATSAVPRSRKASAGAARGWRLRGAEARRAPAPLRPAARARRHAEELGGDARPEPRRRPRSGWRCAPRTIRCSISTSRATSRRASTAAAR